MKKIILSASVCISLLLSACGGGKESTIYQGEVSVIDVETAIRNPQELSLTDLGETMTYVPLETLDESLVKLNSSSKMIITDQYIFVAEDKTPILCFDRSTGKYLRNIGSIGQGPGEYPNPTEMEVDAEAKRIYVRVALSQFQCYDFEGNHLQSLILPGETTFRMGGTHFADNKAYTYCNVAHAETSNQAYVYQLPKGTCRDSLSIIESTSLKTKGVGPLRGTEAYGGMLFMVEYEDGTWTAGNRANSTYQSMEGNVYHKDLFCDTLFQVNGLHHKAPVAAFHLGRFGNYKRYDTSSGMEGKYILPRVLYNGDRIYFTLFTGVYDMKGLTRRLQSGTMNPGCGIYNLQTGEVKVQKDYMYFKHPDEAMPKARVYTLTTDGHWTVVYQAEKLVEARENIPVEQQPEWLKNLKGDDNPVLMMIK